MSVSTKSRNCRPLSSRSICRCSAGSFVSSCWYTRRFCSLSRTTHSIESNVGNDSARADGEVVRQEVVVDAVGERLGRLVLLGAGDRQRRVRVVVKDAERIRAAHLPST